MENCLTSNNVAVILSARKILTFAYGAALSCLLREFVEGMEDMMGNGREPSRSYIYMYIYVYIGVLTRNI